MTFASFSVTMNEGISMKRLQKRASILVVLLLPILLAAIANKPCSSSLLDLHRTSHCVSIWYFNQLLSTAIMLKYFCHLCSVVKLFLHLSYNQSEKIQFLLNEMAFNHILLLKKFFLFE